MMNRTSPGQNKTANQSRGKADRNARAGSDPSVPSPGYCRRSKYHWTSRKTKISPRSGISPTMTESRASRTRFVAFLTAGAGKTSFVM